LFIVVETATHKTSSGPGFWGTSQGLKAAYCRIASRG